MAELREPLRTEEQSVVENVFPLPGQQPGAQPVIEDIQSQIGMEDFLWDRLRPDAQPTRGGILSIPVGIDRVKTWLPRFDKWNHYLSDTNEPRQHWKRAAGIFLAANALLNVVNGNVVDLAADTVEEVQAVKDVVEDYFHIGEVRHTHTERDRVPTTVTTTKTETLNFNSSGESQPVGEAIADQEVVDKVLDSIRSHMQKGDVLSSAEFSGVASDDWRRDSVRNGFGHPNSDNQIIAEKRLVLTAQKLVEDAKVQGIDLSGTTFEAHEAVLEEEDVLAIENAILANGFDSYATTDEAVDAALEQYNSDPASLPETLRLVLHDRLPRGFQAKLEYTVTKQVPGEDKIVVTRTKVKHPDGKPEDQKKDYDLALLPLILAPLPEFRRKFKDKIRTEEFVLPPTMPGPEYLKLYPAARTEDDKLVDEAWAYARKYQHMMRETDRIQGMYRLDYMDAEGNEQQLRAMFIDHEPTTDTFGRVAGLLQTISQMQGGRVGRELDMIAIYPTDNAGPEHGNPKKIALGQDIQFGQEILGLAYASLGLVEMHMPTDTTSEDMGSYMAPDWVLAHEVAGHFTDLNEAENELTLLATRADGTQIFTTSDRHEDFMQDSYDRAVAEERSGQPTRWRVHRRLENLRGEIIDDYHDTVDPTRQPSRFRVVNALRRGIHAVRNEYGGPMMTGDPRFGEALYVRKETGHVDRYGGTNAAERHAQSAASELVSEIPFGQAHDGRGIVTRPDFAQGYHIASRDHASLAQRWGSDVSQNGVVFVDDNGEPVKRPDWQHWYGHPEDDEQLAALMNEARDTALPPDNELLHIVTGTRVAD